MVESCTELDPSVDVVLMCTKGYDLDKAGRELAGRLRPEGHPQAAGGGLVADFFFGRSRNPT